MKKILGFVLLTTTFVNAKAQTQQQIANELTFARLYGYVKYFHPSDEAAAIDWNKFAIYGCAKVAGCANPAELKQTLSFLFKPIAPTLQITDDGQALTFNKAQLMPPSLQGYKTIAWQHIGVGLIKDKQSPYQSARTNRDIEYTPVNQKSTYISRIFDAAEYRGKPFIFKGRAKIFNGSAKGYLWARVDKKDKTMGFFDNMRNRPIETNDWESVEITGIIDTDADKFNIGALIKGNGEFGIDDISFSVKIDDRWKIIYTNSFNDKIPGEVNAGLLSDIPFKKPDPNYAFNIVEDAKLTGEKWATIKSRALGNPNVEPHKEFYKNSPAVGEYMSKGIGSGMKIICPLALYGNQQHTFPAADSISFLQLKRNLNTVKSLNADSLNTRLGDVVIAWNVFQHFFPYFDFAKTNWLHDMQDALVNAYTDKSADDFQKTLQKFTAKLKDGHITITRQGVDKNSWFPEIAWEWVEGKLVITRVLKDSLVLHRGSIVISVNGETPEAYFKNLEQYISAATPGWLNYRAQTESLLGTKGSDLKLEILNSDNSIANVVLKRNFDANMYYSKLPAEDSIKTIGNGVVYLNIGVASMPAIKNALPLLTGSKAIICDLRGYPNDNTDFIEYLLTRKDTSKQWLQTPEIIYPDQEKIAGYEKEGWELTPLKPHINAKIIFIIDGSAISYAESYMSLIENYKLATIIGQPTAGTNGDTNNLLLPGGYSIFFTGLKAVKLDGSTHHGVGTRPDIYVSKTIKGVRENRDEFLEKAIELANYDK